jgi:hypothetical protein
MQFGYISSPPRSAQLAKGLLFVASVASAVPILWKADRKTITPPPSTQTLPVLTARPSGPDQRTIRLKRFLSKLHCPVAPLSDEFVHAADDNQLDWRLLPSIAVIESSGGKAYKNNNIFGWRNGDQVFPTIRVGLNHVAYKLGRSPLYRFRNSQAKLRLYNPAEEYPGRVMSVMNRIAPVADLRLSPEIVLFRQNEYVYSE